jgi:uncharacterized membrane protein YfcA
MCPARCRGPVGAGLGDPPDTGASGARAVHLDHFGILCVAGAVQIPMLVNYGYMNQANLLLSCAALFPPVAGMPLGALLAKHISRERFNQILLVILTILSAKLLLVSFG